MIFEVIDKNKKPIEPQLFLALPNKTIIAKLSEAFNKMYKPFINNLSELSFDMPYKIDINHELIDNPNIEKLKNRYLIKLVLGEQIEWFIIDQITDNIEENVESLSVHCYGLGYELTDKLIIEYNVVSYNLEEMLLGKLSDNMPGLLGNTNWSLGYVDSDFVLTFRSYQVPSKNVLDCVFDVANIFNAVIIWDTINRKINFYKPENIGVNRGLTFSYGKYLRTLSREQNNDEFVTRLKVFGKDKLSINRVNPTGTNYIEDFSYFLYPFERDENRNVVQHSYYMSDALCHAILDYQEKIQGLIGQFENLLSQKETQENLLTQKENELTNLLTELDIILDNLYVAQTHGDDDSDLIAQKIQKENEISSKESEIDQVQAEINNIDSQINLLREELSLENNFTPELIEERNLFIIEKEWREESHINDRELYQDAIKKLEELRSPKSIIKIDVVNFLEVIEEQANWDKLNLGDTITIKYEYLNIKATAKIIGVEYDYENSTIVLTIANITNINSQEDQWYKSLKNAISTSTTVNMNKFRWDRTEEDLGVIDQIINNMWNNIKQQLDMTFNDTVIIDRRGITIIDPADPLRFLRATHGILALTNDGGNTFKHAITPEGIVGERVFGKIISGERVIIGDPDGILEILGNKMIISDSNYNPVMWLGMYEEDKFGLKLQNSTNQVIVDKDNGFLINRRSGSSWSAIAHLDTNGYLNIAGLKISYADGVLANGVEIDSENGITITRGDGIVRTVLNATRGISIQRNSGSSWVDKFFVDTYGVLHAEDLVAKRLILYDDDNELILDANSNIFDINKLDFLGQFPAENIIAGVVVNDGSETNFVGNLAVNRFLSLRSEDEGQSVNYIDIKENTIKFNYGSLQRGQQRKQLVNGEWKPLYWIIEGGKRVSTTIDPEEGSEPVYEYNIVNPITKMQLYFDDDDPSKPVKIQLGEGTGIGERAKGFIWKTVEGLLLRYVNESNQVQEIKLTNSGIDINAVTGNLNVKAGNSYMQFSSNGNAKLYASGNLTIESGGNTSIVTGGNLYLN